MCQTFVFIPDRCLGFPVFGWGWLLVIWGVVSLVWMGWLARKSDGWSAIQELTPFLLVTGAAILFVFPRLEVQAADGSVLGLPIRGYGTFLMGGAAAGWWLSARRAGQRGLDPEIITSLSLPLLLAGIVGARLFFVLEYWPDFRSPTWWETIQKIVSFTEGGLVVYGSLIGGFLACLWFVRSRRLPLLALGDIICPGVVLGMAIGRLGCLMNGCCYGGLCDENDWSLRFPRFSSTEQQVVSPPYQHQLATGQLHGFVLGENESHQPKVKSVTPHSPAERQGLTAGVRIAAINGVATPTIQAAEEILVRSGPNLSVELADGQRLTWSIGALPARSLAVHPSQVYGAISGLLIFSVLLSSEPYLNRRGATVAMLFTLYPLVRFFEEMIRDDEPGQLGTSLTISQWVSFATFAIAMALWVHVLRGERAFDRADPQATTG